MEGDTDTDADTKQSSLSVDKYQPTTMSREEFETLTRNQRKRVMKQELWDRNKPERKQKKKEKDKEARKRKRQRIAQEAQQNDVEQEKSPYSFVIDMDFDNLMEEKEIKSMCSQIRRCYSLNRSASKYVQLHLTQLHDKCRAKFESANMEHKQWDSKYVTFEENREYIDMFAKGELVYLTADSPNVVDTLDPSKVYVIGGLVDKNRYPRLTLDKADKQGVSHAQLPIGQYVQMATRKIMTVNQIFEMLLKYIDTEDWEKSFKEAIPQRKFK